jgi:hypothetical protein
MNMSCFGSDVIVIASDLSTDLKSKFFSVFMNMSRFGSGVIMVATLK